MEFLTELHISEIFSAKLLKSDPLQLLHNCFESYQIFHWQPLS